MIYRNEREGCFLSEITNFTQHSAVSSDLKTPEMQNGVEEIFDAVYNAMVEKGYNPVNQIVGYILSGDPTYVTGHKGARSLIQKVERDEILELLLNYYIQNKTDRS